MSPQYAGVLGATFVMMFAVLVRTAHPVLFGALAKERIAGNEGFIPVVRSLFRRPDAMPGELPTTPFCLGVVGLAIAALLSVGPVPALIALVGGLLLVRMVQSFLRDRALYRYEKQVPLGLDAISRSLRSGAGLYVAIEEAGTSMGGLVGADLSRVAREAQLGGGLVNALDGWAERRKLASVNLCASAMALTIETGAPQAQAVEAVAKSLRQVVELRAKAHAATTDSRVSATMISAMPLVVLTPTILSGGATAQFLFHHPVGLGVLGLGLVLMAAGFMVMNAMIKRATS